MQYMLDGEMHPTTRKDAAYLALRERIVGRQIPPGSPLREIQLAKELGISRTPLREAIRQLSRDGLVECSPHCGARVVQPSAQLVSNIFQIREALEGIAARHAAEKMDHHRLREMRRLFEDLRQRIASEDFQDVGDMIHEEILYACGNHDLSALMANYREMIRWFQRLASEVPGRLGESFREHEAILCALEARDPEWAEHAARSHVRNTVSDLLPHLQQQTLTPQKKQPK